MSTIIIGPLPPNGNAVIRNDSVTPADPTDVYRFSIGNVSNINLALTNISAGDDVDVNLYRDTNNNGVVNPGIDQLIGSSIRGSNLDDSINLADQPAGNYLAQVNRFAPGSSGDAFYRLSLSTADPSNLLPIEENLGNLSADVTRTGQVGNNDTSDVYAFSLGFFEGVNINLAGLSTDADLRIIADTNGNRIVDSTDAIVSSTRGGTLPDSVRVDDAGSYFAQVYQFSGNTNYTLTFDHFNTPGQFLTA